MFFAGTTRKAQEAGFVVVVQGQHRAVSPGDVTKNATCCQLFSGLTLFLAYGRFTGGLGGARGRLGCVGLSLGGLNPVVSP